jgi:E3 ubiquitin-protein ligase SHPRH
VTPPALAPQWVDELRAHAPGLRVLVYDGWATVPVPISAEDVARVRAERRAARLKAAGNGKGKGRGVGGSVAAAKRRAGAQASSSQRMVEDDEEDAAEEHPEDDDIIDWCTYVNQVREYLSRPGGLALSCVR